VIQPQRATRRTLPRPCLEPFTQTGIAPSEADTLGSGCLTHVDARTALSADRCLDPPTRSASPASLLSQPTVYPPIAAVWRIGKSQRHATPTPCNLAGSLMEIPMLNDLLEKVCQRFWFLPGRHSLSCQAGLREARPTRERRPGQLRPQRAMAQRVSRPDYCPRIGRGLLKRNPTL